jgi:prepilin-type N-terminal cleavage/methylation domain-containing protein
MMRNHSGVTLLEMLVAIIVLGIVVLSAGTIYVSSVKEAKRATDEARVQSEGAIVLDHMYNNLMGATDMDIAIAAPPAITVYTGPDGTVPTLRYLYNVGTRCIRYFPNYDTQPGTYEEIGKGFITNLSFTRPLTTVTVDNPEAINNYVVIEVTVQKGRMHKTFSTGIVLRGMEPTA